MTDWKNRFFFASLTAVLWLSFGLALVFKGPHHAWTGINLTAVVLLFGYEFLSEKMLPVYFDFSADLKLSTFPRVILILGFGLIYLLVFWLVSLVFRQLSGKWEKSFQAFWTRFSGLEHYVFLLVVFTIFLTLLVESRRPMTGVFSYMSWRMFWFQVFFLFMDVVYLGLLSKAVSIKEKEAAARKDKELAVAYNAVLERNMESLRAVRHDTKNLFLSMSGFVERSKDEEMKMFYQENIVPFVKETLVKSGIQEQLKLVEDIPLKAFLYYKTAQLLEAKVPVSLELSAPVSLGKNSGDLIRLLGIFIDNASEEAVLADGEVRIAISGDAFGVRFRIENAVRPEVKARGIAVGKSEKGPGRGNGLHIAEKILSEHKEMVLNSYFTGQIFVQSLTVQREAGQ